MFSLPVVQPIENFLSVTIIVFTDTFWLITILCSSVFHSSIIVNAQTKVILSEIQMGKPE